MRERQGLALEYVGRGPGDPALAQRLYERVSIDDLGARGVDEERGATHPTQLGRSDGAAAARTQAHVAREHVAALEQLVFGAGQPRAARLRPCVLACPGGAEPCSGVCVSTEGACINVNNDDQSCGECGNACAPEQTCKMGECVCPMNMPDCVAGTGGTGTGTGGSTSM